MSETVLLTLVVAAMAIPGAIVAPILLYLLKANRRLSCRISKLENTRRKRF